MWSFSVYKVSFSLVKFVQYKHKLVYWRWSKRVSFTKNEELEPTNELKNEYYREYGRLINTEK